MKVLIAAAEVSPFAKVGGLADAIAGLAKALSDLGLDVRIIVPRYGSLERAGQLTPCADLGTIPLEVYPFRATLLEARLPESRVPVYFVENSDFFARAGIYSDPHTGRDFPDNFQRFLFFTKAVLQACRHLRWIPNLIHCNDSQTGLIPAYLKLGDASGSASFDRTASLFTIHNLFYQSRCDPDLYNLTDLPRDQAYPDGPFRSGTDLNPMKAGILFADVITTVSPTYAGEIQNEGSSHELEGALKSRRDNLYGVLNGIDADEWNPATDPWIPARYNSARGLGKSKSKMELQRFSGLPVNERIPLIGMVTRLVEQKGIDLLVESAAELSTLDLQVVLLGTGDPLYRELLRLPAGAHKDRFSFHFVFDGRLAHWIVAGSDMFLMPSRYEPCGLSQMYSLRYGTIPIVRQTGGLADTIRDCHQSPDGNGFKFHTYSSREMIETIKRALWAFANQAEWHRIMRRAMREDFSWRRSAVRYRELYQLACKKR